MTLLQEIEIASKEIQEQTWKRKAEQTSLKELLSIVCEVFDTTRADVQGKCRKRWSCVYPRYAFMWVAFFKLYFKTENIALFLGYRDHSMTCYGRDIWEELLETNRNYPNSCKQEKIYHDQVIEVLYNKKEL